MASPAAHSRHRALSDFVTSATCYDLHLVRSARFSQVMLAPELTRSNKSSATAQLLLPLAGGRSKSEPTVSVATESETETETEAAAVSAPSSPLEAFTSHTLFQPSLIKLISQFERLLPPSPHPIFKWGSFGQNPGQFDTPAALAIHPQQGWIFVGDYKNNRIQKFSSQGQLLTQWGAEGVKPGQFKGIEAIAVHPAHHLLFVADRGNKRIQVFTCDGEFVREWGAETTRKQLQVFSCSNLAVDAQRDRVYVTCIHQLLCFNLEGTLLAKWSCDGKLSLPQAIAVHPREELLYVLVTEGSAPAHVQVLRADGTFLSRWSLPAVVQASQLTVHPSRSMLLVTDRSNCVHMVGLSDGGYLGKWGCWGVKTGRFAEPCGVGVYQDRVYVAEKENHRVQVFQL